MQNYKNYSKAEVHELVLGTLPTREQYRTLAQLLFDPYVTEQKKRLVQFNNNGISNYITEEAGKGYLSKAKYVITTNELVKHVKGQATYGVFAGSYLSKFLCFDIDYGSCEASEVWTDLIVDSLKRHGIREEQIHVSISGMKGYHVDLFFNKALPVETLQLFYERIVMDVAGDMSKVEFRPTSKQGVKLPLGIHRGSHTQCSFVKASNLCFSEYVSIEQNIEYLQRAKENRIDADSFISMCKQLKPTHNTISVKHEHTAQAEKLLSNAQNHMKDTFKSASERIAYCKELLAMRRLKYEGSRHIATLLIAQYIRSLGTEEDAAVNEMKAFIEEAYANDRSKFSESTTLEYAMGEAERITRLVYERQYSLFNAGRREWELYESELTYILEKVNSMPEKRKQPYVQLLFAFLMESKKHAAKSNDYVFYTTYEQLAKYGCTVERQRLKKQTDKLVELGVLEIARVTERKGAKNTPYYYKVHVPKEASDNNKLLITPTSANEDKKIDTVITSLLAEEKVIKLVSKKIYYEHLKPLYSTKMA